MICPYCKVAFHAEWKLADEQALYYDKTTATGIQYDSCPECDKFIIRLISGPVENEDFTFDENDVPIINYERIIYPYSNEIDLSEDIPEGYKLDFIEALSLVDQSPKASAALSRRLLQKLLTEVAKISGPSLGKQIDEFCSRNDLPTILTESVDAIRIVGNFAAHPLKDKNTREIVEVEPGEAEWLIDVLRGLFDYFFVQPAHLLQRKSDLNKKLESLGKPLLK